MCNISAPVARSLSLSNSVANDFERCPDTKTKATDHLKCRDCLFLCVCVKERERLPSDLKIEENLDWEDCKLFALT